MLAAGVGIAKSQSVFRLLAPARATPIPSCGPRARRPRGPRRPSARHPSTRPCQREPSQAKPSREATSETLTAPPPPTRQFGPQPHPSAARKGSQTITHSRPPPPAVQAPPLHRNRRPRSSHPSSFRTGVTPNRKERKRTCISIADLLPWRTSTTPPPVHTRTHTYPVCTPALYIHAFVCSFDAPLHHSTSPPHHQTHRKTIIVIGPPPFAAQHNYFFFGGKGKKDTCHVIQRSTVPVQVGSSSFTVYIRTMASLSTSQNPRHCHRQPPPLYHP